MTVRENIPLAPLTTFRMGPVARYFIDIEAKEDLPEAIEFAKEKGLPFHILGGGSNIIFTVPEQLDAVILRIKMPGFSVEETVLRVGAGEDWDSVVARSVSLDLSGLEAMSAIPGLAGATAIQNVGAYGQEIQHVLVSVDVYEYVEGTFKTLTPSECQFAYRDSIFKHEKRYVVTGITLQLSKAPPKVPDYPGVRAYFEQKGITQPTLEQIRKAIIEIRKTKLPDPKEVASVGSFFKNPFVSKEIAERLRSEYENPVIFEQGDGEYKVGAGWLIDMLGLKGKSFGDLSFYQNNALVITNSGNASYRELSALVSDVQRKVSDRFAIALELEAVFV